MTDAEKIRRLREMATEVVGMIDSTTSPVLRGRLEFAVRCLTFAAEQRYKALRDVPTRTAAGVNPGSGKD